MAQAILKKPKWETAVSARLPRANAGQIWPLLKDFFGVHRYLPNLPTSYGIKGKNGEVGSVRYCEGTEGRLVDGKPFVKWAKEKMIAIDPTQRSLTYEIIDSNIGLNSYVATMKVVGESAAAGGAAAAGCVLECSFSVDPVEGFEFEGLVQVYQIWLKLMAQKMEDFLMIKVNN